MPNDVHLQDDSGLVGSSVAIKQIVTSIGQLAASDSTVMIVGETGTGKELIARAIHRKSRRNRAPFVAVNCGALPETLLESELFGHEKGAFTGAGSQRIGRFEQANRGIVFLDEIHTLSPATQVKLLRVLQEHVIERVGSSEPQPVSLDIRVLAATNQNLLEAVRTKQFREDLFYRLAVCIIEAPPLRKHTEDIPEMARLFLKQVADRDGKQMGEITAGAIALLSRQTWPGNVRQMKNLIDRAANDVVLSGATVDERTIQCALEKESVFANLGQTTMDISTESADVIASLVFDDLSNERIPLEGIKNRSQAIGAVADCLIKGFETGFKQFLETDRGQKLLRNLNSSDVLSRVGLSSRRGGSNALFICQLRDRLTAIIQDSKNAM
jgi:transcriptional regulator with GAF, ATPase, and Fis domain